MKTDQHNTLLTCFDFYHFVVKHVKVVRFFGPTVTFVTTFRFPTLAAFKQNAKLLLFGHLSLSTLPADLELIPSINASLFELIQAN